MTLVDAFLRLNKTMAFTSSEDYQTLYRDGKEWEAKATPDSDNKVMAIYGKIHKGIWVKLLMPIAFYILLNKVRQLVNPQEDELFE